MAPRRRGGGASPARNAAGPYAPDVGAVNTMGRTVMRRDPVAGQDPLPLGRDSVTMTTASLSTHQDPGQHVPELIGFRISDAFPVHDQLDSSRAAAQSPSWAGRYAGDAPAVAAWPSAPPVDRHRHGVRQIAGATSDLDAARQPRDPPAPPWMTAIGSDRAAFAPEGTLRDGGEVPSWLQSPSHAGVMGRQAASPRAAGVGSTADFPALQQKVNGQRLVWLDNGATTQKPRAVIDAVSRFYERDYSNVHRGAHTLAARATDAYEAARARTARYLGAGSPGEIVFVRGTTEAINLVAQAWGRANVGAGDEILVTHLEHHANIVPWQMLVAERGARLRVIPVDDDGNVQMEAYRAMLSSRVRMVALTQVANTTGTVVPVCPMTELARAHGALVLVDGAQSVAHQPVDMKLLGVDFFVFSGHKVYGPTGIGALWARRELLDAMPPWQGGGSMIRDVTFERTVYADPPAKFEAGTPSLADAVGLGAALDYVESVGRPAIAAWEHDLLEHMVASLSAVPGLRIVGNPVLRAGSVIFVVDRHAPQEVARHLDRHGIAVRAGHHCAQPILRRLGLEAAVRASVGLYNSRDDIDRLADALRALPRTGGG
ncbi:MAG: SufS family cysteine desulfurase [Bauldia sp.]|nr:SufS family cysteine desulfurase [Bauldia sp.]